MQSRRELKRFLGGLEEMMEENQPLPLPFLPAPPLHRRSNAATAHARKATREYLARLRSHLREMVWDWGMGQEEGEYDASQWSWYQRDIHGHGSTLQALPWRVEDLLLEARQLETVLLRLPTVEQELLLLERHRSSYLTISERVVFERNGRDIGLTRLCPVGPMVRIGGYMVLILGLLLLLAYITATGLTRGQERNGALFYAFLLGLAYRVIFSETLTTLLWHAALPSLWLSRRFPPPSANGRPLDWGSTSPFRSALLVPLLESAACLVALRRPDLRASTLLLQSLDPDHNSPASSSLPQPTSSSPRRSSGPPTTRSSLMETTAFSAAEQDRWLKCMGGWQNPPTAAALGLSPEAGGRWLAHLTQVLLRPLLGLPYGASDLIIEASLAICCAAAALAMAQGMLLFIVAAIEPVLLLVVLGTALACWCAKRRRHG